MSKYLVRVEAINLSAVLDDTNDISTRRGAGLHLLNAAQDCAQCGTALSTGASAALLRVEDGTKIDDVLECLRSKFTVDGNEHFTFAVAAVEEEADGFARAEAGTIAAVRWQQMQSLSFALPALQTSPDNAVNAIAVCEFDGVRPAHCDEPLPNGKTKRVSSSVAFRRRLGREQRQQLYRSEMGHLKDAKDEEKVASVQGLKFTQDLQALSDPGQDIKAGVLKDKIAVIYLDGNRFGAIGAESAKRDCLQHWDEELKNKRRHLLLDLLKTTTDPRWKTTDNKIRLETLLWGGDEVLFVVPAWLGWPVVDFLHDRTADWKFDLPKSNNHPAETMNLRHAYGLVFCHSKAPIQRVAKLAKDLADYGKTDDYRKHNTVTWTALESFDHLGLALDDTIKRRYGGHATWCNWVLKAEQIMTLQRDFVIVKDLLPRSQIVAAAIAGARDGDERFGAAHKDERFVAAHKRAWAQSGSAVALDTNSCAAWKNIWDSLTECHPEDISKQRLAWIQLAEIWDYAGLDPLPTASQS